MTVGKRDTREGIVRDEEHRKEERSVKGFHSLAARWASRNRNDNGSSSSRRGKKNVTPDWLGISVVSPVCHPSAKRYTQVRMRDKKGKINQKNNDIFPTLWGSKGFLSLINEMLLLAIIKLAKCFPLAWLMAIDVKKKIISLLEC